MKEAVLQLSSWSCYPTQSLSTPLGDSSGDVTALLMSWYICDQIDRTCKIMKLIDAENFFLFSFI